MLTLVERQEKNPALEIHIKKYLAGNYAPRFALKRKLARFLDLFIRILIKQISELVSS